MKNENYTDNESASLLASKMENVNLILKQLFFLGIDDSETMINKGFCSAATVLQFVLETKLVLNETDLDMVVMLHEIEYLLENKLHTVNSYLVVKGKNQLQTAMAATVGLPLGIAAKMILNGEINLKGVHIPVLKEIYQPVLSELVNWGIAFEENQF
jgi:saccharopine dehydrogenase-like NADP-dependent oxidoreductase